MKETNMDRIFFLEKKRKIQDNFSFVMDLVQLSSECGVGLSMLLTKRSGKPVPTEA